MSRTFRKITAVTSDRIETHRENHAALRRIKKNKREQTPLLPFLVRPKMQREFQDM